MPRITMKKTTLTPMVGRIDHAAATQKLSILPSYAAVGARLPLLLHISPATGLL